MAAARPELSHSWPDANSLGVRVERPYRAALGICRGAGGWVFEAGCAALPQPLPLRSSYIPPFLAPGLLTSLPSLGFWREKPRARAVLRAPALSTGGALALALAPTLVLVLCSGPGPCSCSSLNFLAQAQGFGRHLPSLPSAKLLALASRWPLLLAPTSRRSVPTRQFASTSPQSSWTIGR